MLATRSHRFILVAMVALATVTALPLTAQNTILDLATVTPADGVARWVYGSYGQGNQGLPVTGGHDCDGDGHNDYAVGFFKANPFGRQLAGEVDLVFGDGTVSGFVDTDNASDPRVLRFAGAGVRETTGSEVWMDDVTGDGMGDLLICRQNFSPTGARAGAGALTIVVGSANLRTQAASLQIVDLLSPPPGLVLTHIVGDQLIDRLCIWTRTGDVTGDGTADLVIGADQEDIPGEDNRGAAYVVRGGAHLAAGGTIDLANFGATQIAGHVAKLTPPAGSAGYHLGATCQIGDLDGNGRAEVIAAATINRAGANIEPPGLPDGSAEASGGAPEGTFYIAWDDNFPAGMWPAGYTIPLVDATAPGRITAFNGSAANISFGEEILAGLDYDENGQADLFIGDLLGDGTVAADRPFSGVGYIFWDPTALKGLDLDLDALPPSVSFTTILGPDDGAIAADTAMHGDFDGDGQDDLAIGSPHADPLGRDDAGVIHLLFGQRGGWPALIDLAPISRQPPVGGPRLVEIRGAHGSTVDNVGDTLCYSGDAGDLDGDGRDELITNEMVGDGIGPGTEDVGNLILIGGKNFVGNSVFADGFEDGDTGDWTRTVG